MDWRIKLFGQKILEFIPSRVADRLHDRMEQTLGQSGRVGPANVPAFVDRAIRVAKFLSESCDEWSFEGVRVLEVGTGWHGCNIIVMRLLGCESVTTTDIVRHWRFSLSRMMLERMGEVIPELGDTFSVDPSFIRERHRELMRATNLGELLAAGNFTYLAPVEMNRIKCPLDQFDLFFSHSVLQRVKPRKLRAYLVRARQLLRPGGYSYHVIHHTDHNARHDTSLDKLRYLRYSDWIYDLIQSERFNYQNRYRHCEFLALFEACGYESIAEDVVALDTKDLANLPLAPRFRKLPLADLAIARTSLVSWPRK